MNPPRGRPGSTGSVRALTAVGALAATGWILAATGCGPPTDDGSSNPRGAEGDAGEIRELAFVSDRGGSFGLYVMSLAAGDPMPGSTAALVVQDSGTLYGPAWSPDGERLTYEAEDSGGDLEVFVVDRHGGGGRALTRNEVYDGNASWSPDGEWIVFISGRDPRAESHSGRDIWSMRPDGTDLRRLTENAMYEGGPRFSPDGQRIAFCRQVPTEDRGPDGEIFVIDRDGANERRLTDRPGFDCLPDWSPDGTSIAFHSCGRDGCHIFAMTADGSDIRQVTTDAFGGQWPRWSPDGEWIAYTSEREGQSDIYVIRPDGSGQRRLTASPGRDEVAAWRPRDGTPD